MRIWINNFFLDKYNLTFIETFEFRIETDLIYHIYHNKFLFISFLVLHLILLIFAIYK